MPSTLTLCLLPWAAGCGLSWVHRGHRLRMVADGASTPTPPEKSGWSWSDWVVPLGAAIGALPWFLGGEAVAMLPVASCGMAAPWITSTLRQERSLQRDRRRKADRDTAWIVWRRGSIQDEIMRAREHEAMDRRMRRCRSTLLLSRGDTQDMAFLFQRLEHTLARLDGDVHDAAELVGGIASHLRHVFMERDQDDLPLADIGRHVDRWRRWLEAMGTGPIAISGLPSAHSPTWSRRVPSMLFLGMAERMGLALLATPPTEPVEWRWEVDEESVGLILEGGPSTVFSKEYKQDWDAAFMLRHGGISHAGGAWHFRLPLLPE